MRTLDDNAIFLYLEAERYFFKPVIGIVLEVDSEMLYVKWAPRHVIVVSVECIQSIVYALDGLDQLYVYVDDVYMI